MVDKFVESLASSTGKRKAWAISCLSFYESAPLNRAVLTYTAVEN